MDPIFIVIGTLLTTAFIFFLGKKYGDALAGTKVLQLEYQNAGLQATIKSLKIESSLHRDVQEMSNVLKSQIQTGLATATADRKLSPSEFISGMLPKSSPTPTTPTVTDSQLSIPGATGSVGSTDPH